MLKTGLLEYVVVASHRGNENHLHSDCLSIGDGDNTLNVFNKTLSHIPLSACYSYLHDNTLVEENITSINRQRYSDH